MSPQDCDLSDLSLTDLQGFHSAIQEDVFDVLTLEGSVLARNHFGGTSPERVREAAAAAAETLANRQAPGE